MKHTIRFVLARIFLYHNKQNFDVFRRHFPFNSALIMTNVSCGPLAGAWEKEKANELQWMVCHVYYFVDSIEEKMRNEFILINVTLNIEGILLIFYKLLYT